MITALFIVPTVILAFIVLMVVVALKAGMPPQWIHPFWEWLGLGCVLTIIGTFIYLIAS